jgi:HAD superfamily hydrolase (TIGR01509 family)
MFEAVIFDWDGTLADTRQVVVASFQKALREIDCDISDEFIERRIGIGAAVTFREILRAAQMQFDEALISRLLERKVQTEIELTSEVKLFPGAHALLEALHGKLRLGLASMNNRRVIAHLLSALKLESFFYAVLTAEDISRSKPNPEIFLKCAAQLKSAPKQCVVIEDSIFGVEAAKAAGMGCVAVLTGVYGEAELARAKPDLIVKSLREKSRILSFALA